MRVADYIANFLKEKKIKEIFMLTGYGAMYLNDAIKISGIKYYATRNEATAPIMAESYARVKGSIGVACVTAGPGATNALPGLAEAYVDSAPILVLSGQVDYNQTTHSTKSNTIRTFGTAEINIIPIVKPLTKYAAIVKKPEDIKYILEKAFHFALDGRQGPVWIDIPLDVQRAKINEKKLNGFRINEKKISKLKIKKDVLNIINLLQKSKKPLLVVGNGVKLSKTFKETKKIISKLKIPVLFSRFASDLISHDAKYIYGLGGIKASRYCKNIMNNTDLVLSFGCRFSPQFVGHDYSALKNAKIVSIDIEKDELNKKGQKIDHPLNYNLKNFLPFFLQSIEKIKLPNFATWNNFCLDLKNKNPIIKNNFKNKNPMDLYYFMNRLGELSKKKHILVTDAGSNYYIGGQVWKYKQKQKEVSSVTNAAMGLSIPLSIGAAVASPKCQILAVTGDGSLELNIQELKTISHYNFNIKIFVINNGGYVSMHNWADSLFKGRRLDTANDTGDGTLNLKNIAKAFDLEHFLISDYKLVDSSLKKIFKSKKSLFVEVVTDNRQVIFDAFKDI
jgi:acetolactate synthase I/II/III large subunit